MGALTPVFRLRHFPAIFAAFLISGYLLRPTPVWALVFYAGVLPWTAALVLRNRAGVPLRDPGFWLGLAVIAWFALTVTWGVAQTPERIVSYVRAGAMNSVFLLAGMMFFATADAKARHWLYRGISLAGAVNAALSIALYLVTTDFASDRLTGWAETRHEILGADVMMIAVVMTLHAIVTEKRRAWRAAAGAALVLQVLFIVLTGSRGPLLALAAASGTYLAICRPRLTLAAAGAASGATALILLLPYLHPLIDEMMAREPYRLLIWGIALERVAENPLLGYGVATVATFGDESFTFPHSLYVSALYYGGAVGLILLLALLAYAFRRAARAADREEKALLLALLAVPVVAGLTDIGQPIDSPSELWYILWLPVVMAFGRTCPAMEHPAATH